ncbi:MAG: lipoprotein [Clostridia bacterium]|jgi:uncharacterized protein YkwD|nr:lipoprotein [Clostridia bacterium]
MKKLFVVIFFVLLVSGCSKFGPGTGEIPVEESTVSVSQTEIKGAENQAVTSEDSAESTTIPDRDDNTVHIPVASEIRDEESQEETTAKETLPSQSLDSDNLVASKDSTIHNSSQSTAIPQETESQTVPIIVRAGKEDSLEVANRVLYYINEFREEPAIYLPGLAEYARYRSRQLISNFAHSTADQRAAATALQYGEYVDPGVFGGRGEPYYSANAREAIAKAGYVGTVDEVAFKLASLVKNSPSHWNYIGSSEYTYIAVGVIYESDMWYCAIEVTMQNTESLKNN